jgi:ADP-ribose pyrophosphatase YjhB (NUDIX family)
MYENPVPVVVALVTIHTTDKFTPHQLLGVRRGIEPFIGQIAFPGGYVDKGESAEAAASRELFEECGLEVPPGLWQVRSTLCTPRNQLLIFMRSRVMFDESALLNFVPNEETQALATIDAETPMCFSLHAQVRDEIVKTAAPGNFFTDF